MEQLVTGLVAVVAMGWPWPATLSPTGHAVAIKAFQFTPDRLEVAVGDTVVWANGDIVPHTVNAKGGFDSKSIDKDKAWRFVAKKKGTYLYHCAFHPTMKGELVVK